jgi:DNA repair exonuclease SbcCD ATPase subunit
MDLIFGKMHMENFLSFDDEWFDFSAHDGLSMIRGQNNDIPESRNGAGKSNIINAFMFALFGKTLDDIVNKRIPNRFLSADRDTRVTLDFIADGIPYRITTGLKKKSCASFCKLEQLDLPEDEQDISESSQKLTRRYVEDEVIKCKFDIFLRTNVLTSDQAYNFFKLEKKDKRDFIEQVFDLAVFGVMYGMVHRECLDVNNEFGKIEREYAVIENTLIETKRNHDGYIDGKKDELAVMINQLKAKKVEYTKLKDSIPAEFDNFDGKYAELLSRKSDVNDKLNEVKTKRHDVQTAINKKKQDIESVNREIAHVKDDVRSIKSSITNLESSIQNKRDHISKYEELYENLCGDCKPLFDGKFSISDARESIKMITDVSITEHKQEIEGHKTTIVGCNEKNNLHNDVITKHHERIEKIDTMIGKINNALVKIKKSEQRFKELENDRKAIENDKRKLDTIKTRMINDKEAATKIKAEIDTGLTPFQDMVNKQTESFNTIKTKMSEVKNELTYLRLIETIVSDENVRKMVITDLVHLLNSQIATYLNRVGAKFNCVFDEDLAYVFHTESGDTDYANFSSGEKMRLSIAVSFAFRDFVASRSGITSNILMLDEYMDSNLCSKAIKELMNILTEFNIKNKQDIFIVSHRPELTENLFNRVITVEKTDGVSKINIQQVEE